MEDATPASAADRRQKNKAMGWRIGKKIACPACQNVEKEERQMNKPASHTAMPEEESIVHPEASPAAKRMRRMVYAALEDYYDDVAKTYRPSRSDKSIAEELGCAENLVRDLRESDFGPIAEPGELVKLRQDMDAIAAKVDRFRDDAAGFAADLTADILKLHKRLADLAIKNGWKV